MSKQVVMWTALPNGIVGSGSSRKLRVSVFVSPRLQTDGDDGRLSQFPDFVEWPAHLRTGQVSFTIQVGGDRFTAEIASPPPDLDLWTSLFNESTLVRSRSIENLSGRPVSSYPAAQLHSHLKIMYQKVCATSPVRLPDRKGLKEAFRDLHEAFDASIIPPAINLVAPPAQLAHFRSADNLFRLNAGMSLRTNIASALAAARSLASDHPGDFTEVIPDTGTVTSHFAQLAAFHHRPPRDQAAETTRTPPSAQPPMDFHEAVSALGEYPILLRRLGLVIDLELAASGFPQSLSSQSPALALQVIPTFGTGSASSVNQSPFTAYIFEGDRFFLPAPSPPSPDKIATDAVFGLLNLQDPGQFEAIQLDLDGAGVKAIHTVANQVSAGPQADEASDGVEPATMASLRTSGIWIARRNHARLIHERFSVALRHKPVLESDDPASPTFFAEDLIRGYRVDVLATVPGKSNGHWHSLHRRRGNYLFTRHAPGRLAVTISDEGFVQPVAHLPHPGNVPADPATELYVHESVFHWQGWSLAAARPGKTITSTGPGHVPNEAPSDGVPLEVTFAAEHGTLPTLRFGVHYQFRARTVDLAGNSMSLDEADALLEFLPLLGQPLPILPLESTGFTYRRFEPVLSPVLVARERFTEGESLERLVIRSNHDQSAADYAVGLTTRLAFRSIYSAFNDRHVAPPKTSLWMVETLGLLDDAFGARPGEAPVDFERRCARVYSLARKEKGKLNDPAIIDVTTGEAKPIPRVAVIERGTGATTIRESVEYLTTTGTVDVSVTTPSGTSASHPSARFTYANESPTPTGTGKPPTGTPSLAAPVVLKLDPTHGETAGGTTVTVTGAGFTDAVGVTFGGVPAPNFTVVSDTKITVVTPRSHGYALHHEPTLAVPYLPDSLSRSAALFGLPGLPRGQAARVDEHGDLLVAPSSLPSDTIAAVGSSTHIAFGPEKGWPDLQTFRLQVVEAEHPGAPLAWDAATRVLSVPLAKSQQATIRLSSSLPSERDLDKLGIWSWMVDWNVDQGKPRPDAGTVQTAVAGALWMLTPFREITLVHAVQQPLIAPSIRFLRPFPGNFLREAQDRRSTFTFLVGEIGIHGDSTDKVDLIARWEEPVDRIDESPRTTTTTRAHVHVCELPIHLPGQPPIESGVDPTDVTPPGDTPPTPDELLSDLLLANPGVRYVPTKQVIQVGALRHEFGDAKHRTVRYQAIATTRFREYFPPELTKDASNLTRSGEEVVVNILSTAPPAAPKVVYALPLFEWSRQVAPDGRRIHVRKGGGVRIYLERPWFSSGEGEMLGVILETFVPPHDEALEPYITHWGRDPVFLSGPTVNPPARKHFKRGTSQSALSLNELGSAFGSVTVVGYPVSFDDVRQLWFADIPIDAGDSYYPFVRLALARYQPESVRSAHLSRVVVADFVQLAPDRTVTIIPVTGDPDRFNITVEGLTYATNSWTTDPGEQDVLQHLTDHDSTQGTPDDDGFTFEFLDELRPPVRPDLVQVSVERRIPGTKGDAGWETVSQVQAIEAVRAGDNFNSQRGRLWRGLVTLDKDHDVGPFQFRVVIKEFEHYLSDDSVVQNVRVVQHFEDEGLSSDPPPEKQFRFTFFPGRGRLVFAETIEL
jgi:hypothetical protein